MHAAWYFVLGAMLTAYAVLDGFDFGAGIVHLFVARNDGERRSVLGAIGPLWDGNEVWLIASGGVFIFAFPRAYAAAFSGLYLPLMIVLWLLILRGIAIEFRSKTDHPLWRAGWDAMFALASFAMAVVLGVALGNVVRGVPIDATGYFEEDLFARGNDAHAGALDPFTTIFGVYGVAVLGAHGATFLAWKTVGDLGARARLAGRRLWVGVMGLTLVVTASIVLAQPAFFAKFVERPWLWPLPPAALISAATAHRALGKERDLEAFLASCGFIALQLIATAGALYPVILRSTIADAFTIDAQNASSDRASLTTGLLILMPALALAAGYFTYMLHSFRGKSDSASHHY
jgi:cytochrome d ubiquinol oxidase subunit II